MTSEEYVILFCCGPIGSAQVKHRVKIVAQQTGNQEVPDFAERASREHYFLETEKRSQRIPDEPAKMPTQVKGEAG